MNIAAALAQRARSLISPGATLLFLMAWLSAIPAFSFATLRAQTASQGPPPAAASAGGVDEKLLFEGNADTETSEELLSADRRRFAYLVRRKGSSSVVVDGKEGPSFDQVRSLAFSPDSQHFVYVGITTAKKWVAVLDHQPGPAFERVGNFGWFVGGAYGLLLPYERPPHFSPDSRRLAYPARTADRKWVMVIDGEAGPPFEDLNYPDFSPDSRHVAYAAKRGKKWRMVLDGQEIGPEFDREVRQVRFSPDSQRIAYTGMRYEDRGPMALILDGKQVGLVPDLGSTWGFTPDGQFSYVACRREQCQLVLDDKEQGPPSRCEANREILSSPDRRHFACAGKRGHERVIVRDGQESHPWAAIITKPEFSPDSKHLAYLATGSAELAPQISSLVVASDPAKLLLTLRLLDDKVIYPLANITLTERNNKMELLNPDFSVPPVRSSLSFTPDSQGLTYRLRYEYDRLGKFWASSGSSDYTIVERPGQPVLLIPNEAKGLLFSPDGRHMVTEEGDCLAGWLSERCSAQVVIDGRKGKVYEHVKNVSFSPQGSLIYLARSGRKLYLVTQTLP